MNIDKFSRRRLLGGLLAALAACLYPRRAAAASQPAYGTYDLPSAPAGLCTIYFYDHMDR